MGSGNWLQLLLYLLILAGPAIGWAIKKVKEQAAVKAERERRRNLEYESLRTTQVVDRKSPSDEQSEAVERQRAMRELALRRQAQLQELRQRQIEAARQRQQQRGPNAPQPGEGLSALVGGAQAPQQGSLTSTPTPAPLRPAHTPQQTPQAPRRPAAITPPQRQRQPQPRQKQPAPIRRPEAQRPARVKPAKPSVPPVVPGVVPGVTARGSGIGVRSLLFARDGGRRSKDELRRLFALNEVLSKPVSMRKGPGIDGGA